MKATLLLTTALFLASAPSPDSKTVSEFSAGFMAETTNQGLMASGSESDTPAVPDRDVQAVTQMSAPNENRNACDEDQVNC